MTAFGKEVPRIWTPPLRELTPETSLGFEVIDYAREILGVELRPWQRWLLIHALELNVDGSYRFRVVIVLVARQNGKTMLGSVLADWWLHVDSNRHPDRVPPVKFKIVGTAQNLDIAREPWNQVKLWCDPEPDTQGAAELAIPALQEVTEKVSDTNGKEYILADNLATYEIRAAKNARGKPAARVIMDELREQSNWVAWNALAQTTKSFWSHQLWGISNAGDYTSVVLAKQRERGIQQIETRDRCVDEGMTVDEYAAKHPTDVALFEWSAPDGCALDDPEAILQSNPSIGFGGLTVDSIASEASGMTEAGYRTECLCQWVTADVISYIDAKTWAIGNDPASSIVGRIVLAIDTAPDGSNTWIAAAGHRADGLPHVEVIARRGATDWAVPLLERVREKTGATEVALQARGCRAMDFIDPLEDAGFAVLKIEGPRLGPAAGRMRDRVIEHRLKHLPQPAIDQAISAAVAKRLGDADLWDRKGSALDISGLVAETYALYGLETFEPPQPKSRSAYASHGLMTV